jgi:hypothetical protein
MRPDGRLVPEDLARELGAAIEWVEEARWARCLPHHTHVRDNGWFVDLEQPPVWHEAWERELVSMGARRNFLPKLSIRMSGSEST